jgi:serine/threonine-protein kinase
MFPVAVVQALAAMLAVIGLGVASPFNSLLVIGLILYCLSAPPAHARAIYLLLAGAYGALTVLVLLGVLPGTGLLCPHPVSFATALANAVWVEGAYATGYVMGRLANQDSARLVAEMERVVRQAAHREALLREARDELARAAALGGRGPFTDIDLGDFHLGTVIGRGGMGEVYAATRKDGKAGEAAVKLLRRDVLAHPEIVRRFEREARIVASIQSPHVVAVYEVGGTDAPLPYIAMERLRGQDLVAMFRARGTLEIADVTTLVREVSAGLAVAHEAGVVHRDLKPANLFLADGAGGPRWKILDFGISKLLHAEDATLTASEILGTPHYMAPEQAGGRKHIDARADLYALGAILYRALTGQLAFPMRDMAQVIHAVLHEMPEDPRARRTMHDDVALALRIALAKKPEDRFANAREMCVAFEAALEGRLAPEHRTRGMDLLKQQGWGAATSR